MKNALRAAIFVLVLAESAWAFEPFVVKDIRVEGIQRIEAGTVFNYLPVKVGDRMTDEKASAAIRALVRDGLLPGCAAGGAGSRADRAASRNGPPSRRSISRA